MTSHLLRYAAALAIGLAPLTFAPPARALDATLENVTIDNGPQGTLKFGKVELVGANLTKEEIDKLFAPSGSADERKALLAKLKADRISIPEVVATNKDNRATMTGVVVTGVGDGKAARIAVAGIEMAGKTDDGGPMTLKSGAIAVENADLSRVVDPVGGKLSFSRYTLDGFDMTFADRMTPASAPGGNMVNMKAASLTIDATFDAGVPAKTGLALKGMTLTPPEASDMAKQLKILGYDRLAFDAAYAATYDPAAKTFALENLAIDAAGAGAIKLKAQFASVDKGAFSGVAPEMMMGLMGGSVGPVEISIADAGLAQKIIAFAAAQSGKQPAAFQAELSAMVRQMGPMVIGGAPNAVAISDAVARFVAAPASITVALKPKTGTIPVMELAQITDPMAFTAKIDLDVQTTSVATAAATPAPAAPAAAAPAPAAPSGQVASAPQAAAPAAPRRIAGLEAWNAIVGNTVNGKNSDGEEVSEYYLRNGVVKQQVDGETQEGKWAFKDGKVCIEFPEADDDDEVCYRVMLDGDTATFTDDDDEVTTYKVLRGNAKNL